MNRTVIKTLLVAADGVTKKKIKEIEQAKQYACETFVALHTLNPKSAEDIDMCDTLERLQRNSRSLVYLLDMAAQVADCMNREFVDLFQAQDQFDQERADSKMVRWKEIYYAEQQREYDRKYREKSKTLKTED